MQIHLLKKVQHFGTDHPPTVVASGIVGQLQIQCSKGREQNFWNFSDFIVEPSYHHIYTYKPPLFARSWPIHMYLPYLRRAVVTSCDVTDVHCDATSQLEFIVFDPSIT